MTDIPLSLRENLKERFVLYSSVVEKTFTDKNAVKIILILKDGQKVEAVLLSDSKGRNTACLSTQVGCPAGCIFCKTGTMGFIRNLDSTEIAEQLLHLTQKSHSGINNIVIMGMGEPLFNLPQLRKAICFFTDSGGMNFSRRRITVSTCGICDALFDIADNGPYVRLALSLVTADETLRHKLMPVSAANPLHKIRQGLEACRKNGSGRITLEVPLLGGINTRSKDAASAADFAKSLDAVINVIPWNPVEGLQFNGEKIIEPGKEETQNFIAMLESYGAKVTVRHRKGRRIAGACGQLGCEI